MLISEKSLLEILWWLSTLSCWFSPTHAGSLSKCLCAKPAPPNLSICAASWPDQSESLWRLLSFFSCELAKIPIRHFIPSATHQIMFYPEPSTYELSGWPSTHANISQIIIDTSFMHQSKGLACCDYGRFLCSQQQKKKREHLHMLFVRSYSRMIIEAYWVMNQKPCPQQRVSVCPAYSAQVSIWMDPEREGLVTRLGVWI